MRERWISPQFISTNQVDSSPAYGELKEMGARVNHALGIGTSATHMEWFFGDKGLYFSEIGCRPPGVGAWDLYSVGNDVDLYTEWAHAIVHGSTDRPLSRRLASGLVALRPDRDGHDHRLLRCRRRRRAAERVGHRLPASRTRVPRPNRWRRASWPMPTCG